MNELITHIGNIANTGSYKPLTYMPVERSGFDGERDISESSTKYILEKNKIVFERYDRNGKLISRVPWTANRVNAKA